MGDVAQGVPVKAQADLNKDDLSRLWSALCKPSTIIADSADSAPMEELLNRQFEYVVRTALISELAVRGFDELKEDTVRG